MEFSVKSGSPEKQRSACIVVGVFEPRRLSPIAIGFRVFMVMNRYG